ncbi:threonine synthase [Futiania mangrovi]|uniref:Threonine synthase n=1 Tax=Futiania mangrovi TaxID=2959716 RepID=A0A9J6PBS0_9PROT|nr:threonine synthase [Futiania mangrovii]MCP1337604.1 threonine synthase [Futiania mangrovii]
MRYVSTRGRAPVLGFEEVLLAGLARDGGLYVPESWPLFSLDEISDLAGRSYEDVAVRILAPYVGDAIGKDDLAAIVADAYATFRHKAVVPLVQTGASDWLMELFHGPTLAFKDVAMQLIGRLFDHVLTKRGERVTIVGATSGDTGSAAIEAFRDRAAADVFILFPHGRVSEVQRRQMTTVDAPNVHAIAVEGTFDDCQSLVKAMFNDHAFRDGMRLGAVNSINWARVMAQAVYYFTAATALGAPSRCVSFSVPTGNFGDIFAGYVATRMGLPVEQLVIATNANDILARTIETGTYSMGEVVKTLSPSMDIQVSSNFERLLFEVMGRDGAAVQGLMDGLQQSRAFTLPGPALEEVRRTFDAGSVDDDRILATIRRVHAETGLTIDPHTAVGVAAAVGVRRDPLTPMIHLACAHPAKFPDAVEKATKARPGLPPHLADLFDRPERMSVLPNDLAAIKQAIGEKVASTA